MRRVTLGVFSKWDILAGSRAVAKTCMLRCWNAEASEEPMPPELQPVMRTDLRAMVMRMVDRVGGKLSWHAG